MERFRLVAACLLVLVFATGGCAKKTIDPGPAPDSKPSTHKTKVQKPYTVRGETYKPLATAAGYSEEGLASWYGEDFHGRKTANGEVYNMNAMTAAHKLLPFNTRVRVTNLENGKSVQVRINDRGPFIKGRIIDLSRVAGRSIGLAGPGIARVRVVTVGDVPQLVRREPASGDKPPVFDLGGDFYVQVGSFGVRENAQAFLAKVRKQGHGNGRISGALVGGKKFWRVQAGPYAGLNAAKKAQKQLEKEIPSCFVIAD